VTGAKRGKTHVTKARLAEHSEQSDCASDWLSWWRTERRKAMPAKIQISFKTLG